jgi:hypothetical protein
MLHFENAFVMYVGVAFYFRLRAEMRQGVDPDLPHLQGRKNVIMMALGLYDDRS